MKTRSFTELVAGLLLFTAACQKETSQSFTSDEGGKALKSATNEPTSAFAVPFGTLVDGATYRIRGMASLPYGPVVEVTGNSTAENAQIQQWSWFPNNGQRWKLEQVDATYYKLMNLTSSKYLESPSVTSGDILRQGSNDGTDSQLWAITYSGSNNIFSLTNKATGMKMVIDPASSTAGAKVRQKTTVAGTQDMFGFHNLNFQNPLIDVSRPDPYVAEKDGYYYFMYTRGNKLSIRKTTSMSLLSLATDVVVWTPPTGTDHSANLWAPELHFLSGKWYLYFAANDGVGEDHRMFVLENANADPTSGTWTYKGKITDTTDQWAIDGTVLTIGTSNYFVWSGWETVATKYKQYLYLAPMSSPWTLTGARIKISSPTNNWEKYEPSGNLGAGVNEGPIMLRKDAGSPVFIIYSASRYSSDNYCLAQIQLATGGNPTVPADWINKKQVFVRNDANAVYGPGHNGFFTSSYTDPNGVLKKENWFIYHARSTPNNTGGRTPRMQKLTWNTDGSPNFGTAAAIGINTPIPVGE